MASPVIVITRTVIPIYSSVFIGTRISVMEWLSACLTVVCAVVVSETWCERCLMEVKFGHEASEQVFMAVYKRSVSYYSEYSEYNCITC